MAAHMVCGCVIATAYGYLAMTSTAQPAGTTLAEFLAGYWLIAAAVFAYWSWLYRRRIHVSFAFVLVWAIIFRAIGVLGEPILEDDFFRYLLDGCMFASAGTPYGVAPAELFQDHSLTPECRATLNGVNNPDLPTIYAPVLQYLFVLAHYASPADVNALQMMFSMLDIACVVLLARCASTRNVLLYAWSPLVLKEIAFTAHPDIVGACLVLAAFLARRNARDALSCFLIAAACCTKIVAVLALPFILHRQPLRNWAIALATALALYAPFLLRGGTDLPVLATFAATWQFNALAYELVQKFAPDQVARYLCATLYVIWYGFYFVRYASSAQRNEIPRMDWVFGLFFLLAPVVNPWYLIWLLPFAVIRPSCWAWTASVVVSLSYVTGLHLESGALRAYEIARPAWILEISAIAAALAVDYWLHRRKLRAAS